MDISVYPESIHSDYKIVEVLSTSDSDGCERISRRKKRKFAHAHGASYARCKASGNEKRDEMYTYIPPGPRDIFYQRWRCINPFFPSRDYQAGLLTSH